MLDGSRYRIGMEYTRMSGAALVFYDYLLMFGDEMRYVWKGRKSWIFYLYITLRVLLFGYQFWNVHYIIMVQPHPFVVPFRLGQDDRNIQSTAISVFGLLSDIFIILRVFAITSKNKITTVYLTTLACVRLVVGLMVFRYITDVYSNSYWRYAAAEWMVVFLSLGAAFEISAFAIVVWYTYRQWNTLKISALLRVIATQSTMYFLAILITQIYFLLQRPLLHDNMKTYFAQPYSFGLYCFFTPVLTLRFVISLKKSADPGGGEMWQLRHFSTMRFASGPTTGTQGSAAHQAIEMDPVDRDAPFGEMLQVCEAQGSTREIEFRDA